MSVVIEQLEKSYGTQPVLRSITEHFAAGEISVLLGASGCGKTTTLRCVVGLERPSAGRVEVGGRVVYRATPPIWVPVERRQVSMAFQSYAIWPHMTVFENVSMPLRASGLPRRTVRERVDATLKMVGLADFADRSATKLSGGQQQRVALARCIVSDSQVILMDEPLSNLDARLRVAMRAEIRDLQRRLERTILFVTHDQEEAMSIADTIYLFRDGNIIQRGRPREMYDRPETRYAAEFLGRANIITEFSLENGPDGPFHSLPGGCRLPASPASAPESGAALCIRPEKWRAVEPEARDAIRGRVIDASFVGDRTEFRVDSQVGELLVVELSGRERRPGEPVALSCAADDIRVVRQD